MPKQRFLNQLRIARNLFAHSHVEPNGLQLDPQALAQKLTRAAIWLTPRSFDGFDAADFPELGLEGQRELESAVRRFLDVANQVSVVKPVTAEQFGKAANVFAKIVKILDPYVAPPKEGRLVAEALGSVSFPNWVVNWDYELGNDQEDFPAVWVNVYVDDRMASPRDFARLAPQLTQKVHQALSKAGVSRWPFIRMGAAAEQKAT